MGISRWEMRPVTLSSAANTAIGFLIFVSAAAAPGAGADASESKNKASRRPKPVRDAADALPCSILPHTV
jgi:hypothetical protein